MKQIFLGMLIFSVFVISGCAMFSAWRSIPPPGGCDQCHTVPITRNWQAVYKAPMLNDERNREYFQSAEYSMPQQNKQTSTLDVRKVEELACFDCHKLPSPAHKERKGKFHH